VLLRKEREKKKLNIFYFFFVTRGVRASLRAPQLIPGPTEHCKPSRQVRHHGVDRRARWDSNSGDRGKAAGPQTSVQKKKKSISLYQEVILYWPSRDSLKSDPLIDARIGQSTDAFGMGCSWKLSNTFVFVLRPNL